jgi:hypothetical protein
MDVTFKKQKIKVRKKTKWQQQLFKDMRLL